MLVHFLKREQMVFHIAFLRLCKREKLIPFGLRCKDKLADTFPSKESTELAQKHSLQFVSLLINVLYRRLFTMRTSNINGPLCKLDDTTFQNARVTLLRCKVKKLKDLKLEICADDSSYTKVRGFTNLSGKIFTDSELDLLNRGPSYAPKLTSITKTQKLSYESNLNYVLGKLHIPRNDHRIQEFSGTVRRILDDAQSNSGNKDNQDMNIVKDLRKDGTIFVQSDKSKRMVAMSKMQHAELVEAQLDNFQTTRFIQPVSAQMAFNKKINTIAKNYPGLNGFFRK